MKTKNAAAYKAFFNFASLFGNFLLVVFLFVVHDFKVGVNHVVLLCRGVGSRCA